jgi:hypothetical protein
VWRGYPVEGYYDARSLTGLWSTQAKVEGIVHGTGVVNSSVVNNPLGEPGRTPLFVGLPSVWDSVDGDHILFPVCCGRAP